jgi:hypothetical protein
MTGLEGFTASGNIDPVRNQFLARAAGIPDTGRLERSRCGGGRIRVFLSRRFLRLPQ